MAGLHRYPGVTCINIKPQVDESTSRTATA